MPQKGAKRGKAEDFNWAQNQLRSAKIVPKRKTSWAKVGANNGLIVVKTLVKYLVVKLWATSGHTVVKL